MTHIWQGPRGQNSTLTENPLYTQIGRPNRADDRDYHGYQKTAIGTNLVRSDRLQISGKIVLPCRPTPD